MGLCVGYNQSRQCYELEFTPRFLHAEAHEVPEALELRELGSPQLLLFPKDQ